MPWRKIKLHIVLRNASVGVGMARAASKAIRAGLSEMAMWAKAFRWCVSVAV